MIKHARMMIRNFETSPSKSSIQIPVMSDTRDDAEQQMVNAGIASGLEDTLGVSLIVNSAIKLTM